ncbi:MAG TPA: response regulator [Alphaproteobacteria bacterium]|nr:response regulator [Alphaproteobacteria bacterium]
MSPVRGPLPRILVCEDDGDTAHLLQGILEGGGLAADIARDAEAAKRMLAERDYLAMTLDIALPGQSGIELIRELRQQDGTRELPIVVVSAHIGESRDELSGDAFPVVDWLDKPIDHERLAAAVQSAMRRHPGDTRPDARPSILHVEDDADVRQVVATLLGQTAEVMAAASVGEARQKLAERTYDLLVLDLSLPDGSGLTLLPDLRRHMPLVPVLVFSAHESGAEVAREVAQVLVKSRTSNDQLLAAIKTLIGGG